MAKVSLSSIYFWRRSSVIQPIKIVRQLDVEDGRRKSILPCNDFSNSFKTFGSFIK